MLRSAIPHRFLRVKHRREHLIFHLDETQRLAGQLWGLGRYHCHPVSHVAHLGIQNNLIKRGWLGVALTAGSVFDTGDILIGQDSVNARQRACSADLYSRDAGMGVGAGEQRSVEHSLWLEIGGKDRPPLCQLFRIHFDLRLSDHPGRFHLGRGKDQRRQWAISAIRPVERFRQRHFVFQNPLQVGKRLHRLASQQGGRSQYGIHHSDVTRAAAEHAAHRFPHLAF